MGKDKYKVCNWPAYNTGLKQRGAITVWISEEALKQWRHRGEKNKGGQRVYSDLAIEVCLMVRKVYHLGYRQTEGFVESFFRQTKVALPVPSYSQLCRRSAALSLNLGTKQGNAVTDIVVASTGLKVHGEGEWKVRKHGWCKHRTWMKLHVALDADDQQVQAVELTTNGVDDATAAEALVKGLEGVINSFTGDGRLRQRKDEKMPRRKSC